MMRFGLLVLIAISQIVFCETRRLAETVEDGEPVNVLVLTESLCPGCEEFIQGILFSAFKQLGPSVMDLYVLPYGNAKITNEENHEVTCQHGKGECDGNVYELCAIHHYPDPAIYLPFLECLTHQLKPGYREDALDPSIFESCAKENHMWWPPIEHCHETKYWEMLKEADDCTPDHDYVPWIVVDGEHIEDPKDFVASICDAFQKKGGSYPACTQLNQEVQTATFDISVCPATDEEAYREA